MLVSLVIILLTIHLCRLFLSLLGETKAISRARASLRGGKHRRAIYYYDASVRRYTSRYYESFKMPKEAALLPLTLMMQRCH